MTAQIGFRHPMTIKPKVPANIILWIILAFVLVAIGWAALTEIDRTVRANGRVIPSSQLQVVSNLEGGVVEQIMVKVGQDVRQGTPLVRLSPVQPGAELEGNLASSDALNFKIVRLTAEITGQTPKFPQSRNAMMAAQIAVEQGLYRSRMAELASISNVASARVDQARRAIAEASAAEQARIAARDAAQADLNLVRPLVREGIEPRRSLLQAESSYAVSTSEAAGAAAALARARSVLAEAQASAQQQRRDWLTRAADELTAARADLSVRQATMPAYEYKLRRTVVRAPLDGRINRVFVTTVGGSVRPGDPLLEMVAINDTLLIEAAVAAKDIASVKLGQQAKVQISAYDSAVYGSMKGKVVAVSPDAVLNERTGESHYLVRVRTTANAITDDAGRRLPIGPGMGAEVNLLGDKRTVLAYILTPLTRLSETAFRE
ncbi:MULTISPECIES: HlyD family type I secretion periplasmic adaptor subunit [Sphingobium]|jgi:membrane fusion protein, adhesin transport system|uniref:HlyD family type I secretion periplasmic adaptor subunit n=1 Tax=Sphingobium TaxID=165695 RepID=UPI000C40BDC9|nr:MULTISPECIES: HlyD family type I secretion periplasmic adaptor subunit [Sphingobium]MAX15473.1 secretion protein HlyD [Sphingobium sp.]MEE2741041.1 HlyD family type I secretion periplasmic adaptor subunit [Pseudomonadota bacterium]MBA38727.1 secretion protein HlyD [Sphingobium sp.]MBS46786.1 secretion protein HlyD [Sphingobium sp.]HCW59545.1 HlyD family type I secretion periplasmic adaptor subunit [Sphingobium sp.]